MRWVEGKQARNPQEYQLSQLLADRHIGTLLDELRDAREVRSFCKHIIMQPEQILALLEWRTANNCRLLMQGEDHRCITRGVFSFCSALRAANAPS